MLFETVKSEGLAHLSYVLGDPGAGVCAVIDPRRDVERYLQIVLQHQVRITRIVETHIHADFVSGSRELAARTGAPIYGGASEDYDFEIEPLTGGDTLEVGALTLRVLATPGHSPEHISLAVRGGGKGAEEQWGVFSGDTLFAGEVGRPDLVDGGAPEEQAGRLYHTFQDRLLALPDGVEVYPAHGKGSPCGGDIGVRDRTTIGYERRHNGKLRAESQEAFVERVLEELEQEPFYYERLKRLNARGPDVLGAWPALPALSPETFEANRQQEDTLIVDTREIEAFAGAHVEGSLSLPLRTNFPVWAGWMLDAGDRLLLIADGPAEAARVRRHLLRTGFDRVEGFLAKGLRGWIEAGRPFDRIGAMSVHELKSRIEEGHARRPQVLDVRSEAEWQQGHIPTAQHAWLPYLTSQLGDFDREEPVAVYCGSGYRASIAASVLRREGFAEVANVPGSMSAWKAAGYELVSPEAQRS